jgi:hypothetical protein
MLGQIRWSKSSVEFIGQIAGRIHGSNSLGELLDQIRRSNSWIKFLGQIVSHVTPDVTGVTPDVTSNARDQTQAILGPLLANLGECMGTPCNGLKTA